MFVGGVGGWVKLWLCGGIVLFFGIGVIVVYGSVVVDWVLVGGDCVGVFVVF